MNKASVIMVGYTDIVRVKDFWLPLISTQHSSVLLLQSLPKL